jgi:hypothetical protein
MGNTERTEGRNDWNINVCHSHTNGCSCTRKNVQENEQQVEESWWRTHSEVLGTE